MYTTLKRLIDIVGSLVLAIIFLPVSILVALAIVLDSPGPVFADTPQRVGKGGKPFKLYKFRSMIVNAHVKLRTDPKLKKLYQNINGTVISAC